MTLTSTRTFADRFEAAAKVANSPRRVVSLITSELTGRLKAAGLELEQSPVSLAGIVMAADLAESGDLSSKMLKQLLETASPRAKTSPRSTSATNRSRSLTQEPSRR